MILRTGIADIENAGNGPPTPPTGADPRYSTDRLLSDGNGAGRTTPRSIARRNLKPNRRRFIEQNNKPFIILFEQFRRGENTLRRTDAHGSIHDHHQTTARHRLRLRKRFICHGISKGGNVEHHQVWQTTEPPGFGGGDEEFSSGVGAPLASPKPADCQIQRIGVRSCRASLALADQIGSRIENHR